VRPGVDLISDLHLDHVGHVIGDPHRLTQLIINFLSNAAKFTVKGHKPSESFALTFNICGVIVMVSPEGLASGLGFGSGPGLGKGWVRVRGRLRARIQGRVRVRVKVRARVRVRDRLFNPMNI
jgi:signal transduction histidine kinase